MTPTDVKTYREASSKKSKSVSGRNSVERQINRRLTVVTQDGHKERPTSADKLPLHLPYWNNDASVIYTINTYPNGVTLSIHRPVEKSSKVAEENGGEASFMLRSCETRGFRLPAGKFFVFKDDYARALEHHLQVLSESGALGQSLIVLGMTTGPFLSFHKRFKTTMTVLDLLSNISPAKLLVQTRSPLVIAALPYLKAHGDRAVVGIHIETMRDDLAARYLPGKPRIGERLTAARGLRMQGVPVHLVASPLLPYGHRKRDAWQFAELLASNGDFVTASPLVSEPAFLNEALELEISQRLLRDGHGEWLHPECHLDLVKALREVAPEKTEIPAWCPRAQNQLSLFRVAS